MKKYREFINEGSKWDYRLNGAISFCDSIGIETAINNGADIHFNNDNALRWASRNGKLKLVKFLVEKGANIHADRDYALRWASHYGRLEMVKYLCEWIIQKEPWYIPKIMEYIPDELKEKYPHLFAASDMDLL